MSSNELFSDDSGAPQAGQSSKAVRRPSHRKLGVKGVGRLLFGLILIIGTFAGVTAEALFTSATAGAATGTYTCTTPASGGTSITFYTGVTNPQSIVCYGVSGVTGTTAYPASITLNTGSLPPGTTEGTSTTSTPACATSTSGSATTEHYILTCPISDNPATGDIGSYPVTFTANPGTDGGTATNSGTDTITVSNTTQACIAPASGGTAQKFDEGYTNTYTVQCENETHVSGQAQYPSSIALTSGSGPADAPVTFATSTSSSPACTQSTSGSAATEEYILSCALTFAPTTSDAGSYPFTFTPTTNGVVGPTSGALTITVGTPTLTCTAPAAVGTATTFNSSAAGTNNSFNVVCNGVSGLTGLATYPTSIVANSPGTLPTDLVSATSTSSSPACTRSVSGSGAAEQYILTCPQTESAVPADNGSYTSTYTATDSNNGATGTSGAWNLTVTGPSDVCTAPAAGGTATTFKAGIANTFSVACYGTGFASADPGNYPSAITVATGSLPADATFQSVGGSPACTTSTSGSGVTEHYIDTCIVSETPTAADLGSYPLTFSATPGANGGSPTTSGTWTLTVAAITPTCIDPASAGTAVNFYENVPDSYVVECEAQSGVSGTSAYPTSIAISTGSLPGDGNPTFATSTSSTPACTTGTSGTGTSEQYILECALADNPTSSDGGVYPLTFTATGPGGAGTVTSGTLNVTVTPPTTTCTAPAAGGTSTSWTDGTAASFSVVCSSSGFASASPDNYPSSITLNSGTLPSAATEATSTASSPACTQSTSGSGVTEQYILTCPVADNPTFSQNGTYTDTFLATGGANGAPNATSGTWTLKVSQPAPSWATSGTTDGNYFSAIKGVPFCYDLEVSAGQAGPSGTNPGSTGSLPLTSLTAGTTPSGVTNYSIQDINLAAGTAQICGTNNNNVASAPVTMAPVATNSGGTATDSIPLWSQNDCTWSSSGATVSTFDTNQDISQSGSQSAFGQPITNGAVPGSTKDIPTCTGGVGVSASGGLGDAWTMNTANPLPTPTDSNPSAALGDLPSSNLDLTSASGGAVGGCWGAVNILASTSTNAFGASSTASMTLPSTWVNGGNCSYGGLGSNSAGGNTDTPALSGPTGDASCPPTQEDVNAGLVDCTVVLSSGNDENGSTNYASLDVFYNGQPVPQAPTASLSSSVVLPGDNVSVSGGSNWWGAPSGAPNAGPYGDFQNSASNFYPVGAPQVLIGTSRGTAVPVVNPTVTIGAVTYACTGAESTTVGPNPCSLTVGQPTGSFQVPTGLAPGTYNIYIDETNTSPLPGNGPNDSYQTNLGTNLGTVESSTQLVIGSPPAITSDSSTAFTESSSGSFTVTTTGTPNAALSETGALPDGVSFVDNGDGTGTLSGTPVPGSAGSYPFTITATNGESPDASQSFTLTVDQGPTAPVITSDADTTFTQGSVGTFTVTSTGIPAASLSETGALPSGVSFTDNGDGTATLAGNPGVDGTFPITINATNGVSPDASQSFTLTVNPAPAAPVITSGSSTTFTEGSAGSFSVTSTGNPTAALSETGALPSDVTFTDNGDGTAALAGTPAVGSAGSYPITISGTNGVSPDASQSFTLTVNPPPAAPVITSGSSTTFTKGSAGTFTVTSTGVPTAALSETGALPSGVTFTSHADGTATLAGNPGVSGTFPITIHATNGVSPDASQSFTLTVNAAPAITSGSSTTFVVGTSGSFTVTSTGHPTAALSESGTLPSGVSFTDNGDGTAKLSGTPAAGSAGSYPITIGATNGIGSPAHQTFTLTVNNAPAAPVITSASSTSFTAGTAGTFHVTATGNPAPTITESGTLPSGVTFSGGVLSGTATVTGTYPITFTATNGVGSPAHQSFTLTVLGFHVTTTSLPNLAEGTAYSQQLNATGGTTPYTWKKVGTLPKGLTLSSTGVLSGTVTVTSKVAPGSYTVQVTVSDATPKAAKQTATASLTLIIQAPPAFTSATSATFNEGSSNSFTVTTTGGPTPSVTESGTLPTGVTFSGGVLSGTPTVAGSFPITFTASNGIGSPATQHFTLAIEGLRVTTTSLPPLTEGTPYSQQLTAADGIGTYKWAKVAALPKGLSLSGTGLLKGNVSAKNVTPGTYPIQVTVTDSTKHTVSATINLTINS